MSARLEHRALRRKIAAHARPAPRLPDPTEAAGRGYARALRRASTPFEGLGLIPGQIATALSQSLDASITALPVQGLIAALEDGRGRRGLIGLSPGLVDALVEVQTTGRVEAAELAPRAVTRIDEALARDFIDLALAAFAQEVQGIEGRDWPDRMGYGSRIRDPGQINLLLPEGGHAVLTAEVGFEGVARRAQMVLVLPQDPELAQPGTSPGTRATDPAWIAARERIVAEIRLSFEVVLLRLVRPLAEVQRLAEGDLLPFSTADLHEVSLEDGAGRALIHGRLGQVGGRRALRLAPKAPRPLPEPEGAAQPFPDPMAGAMPGPIPGAALVPQTGARSALG